MQPSIIELQNVRVAFGKDTILDHVNMKIFSHETIVIIGLSGSGKTVLLKILAGIYKPVEGTVLYYGKSWQDLSSDDRHALASHVGMQFQKSALFDDLDVFENVAYPLREHTADSENQIKSRVIECLQAVGLEKSQHMQPHELSGGMKQRLGIARAIALKPDILFMDDPTAGLDPISSDNMADLILNLKKEINATLIVVTHDLLRAYQFAGRIFFVGSKSVIETGSADQTRNHSDARIQQYLHGQLKGPLTDAGEL